MKKNIINIKHITTYITNNIHNKHRQNKTTKS